MRLGMSHVQLSVGRVEFCQCTAGKSRYPRLHENRSYQIFRISLLLALAPFAQGANQPTLPPELSLSEALSIALSNSATLRTAQSNLERASGQFLQARSELLPRVDVLARQAFLTINLVGIGIDIPSAQGKIGPFASMDARAFLRQDLLNIAALRSQQSFRWAQDSSRFLVNNARETVTLDVVATYLIALRAKTTRDTLTAQRKLAEGLCQVASDRARLGAASQLDVIRATQQVNTLEQRRQEAEQDYIAAKLSLANILQARITANFDVSDNAAYGLATPLDRDAAIDSAFASRADYRAALADVKAAELRVRSIKASRLPTVAAGFDDGQSGFTPAHNVNTYRIQGSIFFPVFTGGRIRGEIQEAEGALRGARATLDQGRSQIETDVLTAVSGVEWALKEVQTSAGNVNLSRQEVELSRQRFIQGIADNTEVLNAQARLSQADDAQIRAQYTLGLARANLARATGAAEKTYRK